MSSVMVVSILSVVEEAHIQTNDSLREIFGGRNGSETGLSLNTLLSLSPVTPSVYHIHLFIYY
jgi:hypothetical protein